LIWATLSIAGLAFLPLLHVKWQPSQTLPSITVSYSWSNVSGRVIEQEVTSVLEGSLNRIRGIRKISSTSRNNSGYISIEFDKTVNMDEVRFEAASIIRQLYPKLPDGISFPSLSLNRPNNQQERSLLVYSLQAPANPAGIQEYAEEVIKPALGQIEGISTISVYGASPYEWMVEYDADQLKAIGLTPASLNTAIRRHYSEQPLGMVQDMDTKGNKAWVQLTVTNLNAHKVRLEEIPLTSVNERVIYLGDIATIKHTEREPTSYFRMNGLNTINIVIYASPLSNHIVLANEVNAKIAELEKKLPGGYELQKRDDSTEYIKKELDKIYIRTIATICILLIFILLVTRKVRFLLIILISIIVNICVALGMYYLLNIEIHLYSLAGITISLGLIIDNTIVMVEHIRSRGNRRVFVAILAATLTTAISLSSVFFLDERIKLNLSDFAIVVIINLMVSLAGAWFLTPALYVRLIGPISGSTEKVKKISMKGIRRLSGLSRFYTRMISGIRRRSWIAWVIVIIGFGLPVFMLPNKLEGEGKWPQIYNKTLGSSWYVEKAKPIVDKSLGGALRLFVQFVFEGSNWSSERQRTTLNVYATMPPGSTIMQMNQNIEKMEKYLSGYSGIDKFQANIYSPQRANVSITFTEEHEYSYLPFHLKNELVSWGINSGAADWTVYGVGDYFSNQIRESTGQHRIQLYGYNYDELYIYGENIGKGLMENPRIKEVNLMSRYSNYKNLDREFVLRPDVERLYMSGISLPQYFNIVQIAAGNEQTATSTIINDSYQQIKIRSKQLPQIDQWLMHHSLMQSGDNYFKLSSVSEMVKEDEQQDICKEDQQYTLTVSYDYIGSSRFASKLHERTVKEANEILPLGYKAEAVGGNYWWKKEKKQYWIILLILIVMYVLCSILFESLRQPLAVISLVPFAFIGLFLTFYLFGLNFDQGGFAAMVLLCGLTVNAAIYIINDYNNLRRHSPCSPRRLYLQALHGKITPVLLTILSTILGLIPFVIGKPREPFWFALAAGTMGGLLFSLVGILVYLPLFFFRKRKKQPINKNSCS
jgi:multidrug efflux pump subunit AcrB